MLSLRRLLSWKAVLMLVIGTATARPLPVPPGQDPGGVAVAVVSLPFTLTDATLQARLARDGEGVAIGWDFSQNPSGTDGHTEGTGDAMSQATPANNASLEAALRALVGAKSLRLIPMFVAEKNPTSWAKAIAFVARTPAKFVVLPSTPQTDAGVQALHAAATHFSHLLFVMPAGPKQNADERALTFPTATGLSNVLHVGRNAEQTSDVMIVGADTPNNAALAVARTVITLLSCVPTDTAAKDKFTKIDALADLAAHAPKAGPAKTQLGALRVTPCQAAMN